jgi:beta-fructofuranosidase
VPAPPAALGSTFHRDPFLWKDSNGWHLLLGSGRSRPPHHGCLVIYHSPDATSWRYGGVFLDGSGLASALDLGALWECPQLIQLGEAAVLLLSCQDPDAPDPFLHTAYLVGHLDGYRFRPSSTGLIDHGDAFYAATAGQDSEGRPLIFGWARETLPAAKAAKMARVGALTLPRTLHLDGNHVKTTHAPQLARLRASAPRTAGAPGQPLAVGAQFEVHAYIGGTSGGASIAFRPPGQPPLTVTVNMSRRTLEARSAQRTIQAPIPPASDGSRSLQIYGDGSLIEIFFGGETALTTRWYRAAAHCEVSAHPATGDSVSQVTAWDLISNAIGDESPQATPGTTWPTRNCDEVQ